ncbi:MAG: hypothetical protein JMN25_10325 [gamma proteobacterium endosymbiont of Lamellibrachia anaximandri]|nr:hypothetical protein [gamma proteobacterium endosymbiont of Lamellibrachia anaximandri]
MKISVHFNRLSPFWFAMAILAMLFTLVGIGIATWQLFEDPVTIHDRLNAAKPYLFGWRVLLLTLLIAFWPNLMAWLGRCNGWSTAKLDLAIGWRWRAALWLMVIEVGLVQGVIAGFLRNIFQG